MNPADHIRTAEVLEREAEALRVCHTLNGEWWLNGRSDHDAKSDHDEMLRLAALHRRAAQIGDRVREAAQLAMVTLRGIAYPDGELCMDADAEDAYAALRAALAAQPAPKPEGGEG